jgi:hypothetical protein
MKKLAISLLLLTALLPVSAQALNVDNLLGVVAMPVAVCAVSNVAGVPEGDLGSLVATMNQADVAPAPFVQVMRYVPVALVRNDQPGFVQYVRDEVAHGYTSDALVDVMDRRLRTYDVTPQIITLREPATTYVVQDDYIPTIVVTRVTEWRANPLRSRSFLPQTNSFDTNDLLALIAMPLAVDAVSNLTGVPSGDLANFVASLNRANVAPVQFVEVLRYAPVGLVEEQPAFVQYVQDQAAQGISGNQLVTVIDQRLRSYDTTPRTYDAPRPRTLYVDQTYIPPAVVQRVAEAHAHPHGGPPGQLKKLAGYQTGAEIVHGSRQVAASREVRVETRQRNVVIEQPRVREQHGHGKGRGQQQQVIVAPPPVYVAPPVAAAPMSPPPGQARKQEGGFVPPGQAKKQDGGMPPGQAKKQEGGGGKGKGHRKD